MKFLPNTLPNTLPPPPRSHVNIVSIILCLLYTIYYTPYYIHCIYICNGCSCFFCVNIHILVHDSPL